MRESASTGLENIAAMRLVAGIDDPALCKAITHLHVGDHVNITFLTNRALTVGVMLAVRITSIRAGFFRGKLVDAGGLPALSGRLITFTADHIHSMARRQTTYAS